MEIYIGSSIVLAEKKSKNDFNIEVNKRQKLATIDTEGYHVLYPNPDPDDAAYNSWLPKEIFENMFRPVLSHELQMITDLEEFKIQQRNKTFFKHRSASYKL